MSEGATGRCFCGGVTGRFDGEPFWIAADHDEDCRRATGGALLIWIGYRPEQVRLEGDSLTAFSRTAGVVRLFCRVCGTSIAYEDARLPDEVHISLGFMEDHQAFAPQVHAFWGERLRHVELVDDLPKEEAFSRERDG